MTAPLPIPAALTKGPFTTEEAKRCGISEKVLRGHRFIRLQPCVWVMVAYTMSELDWIRAAELALPAASQASHLTRMRKLGLEYGPLKPLHFSIQGELHLALTGIQLHRTKVMPPTDLDGVTPAAAFIGYAAADRVPLLQSGCRDTSMAGHDRSRNPRRARFWCLAVFQSQTSTLTFSTANELSPA